MRGRIQNMFTFFRPGPSNTVCRLRSLRARQLREYRSMMKSLRRMERENAEILQEPPENAVCRNYEMASAKYLPCAEAEA